MSKFDVSTGQNTNYIPFRMTSDPVSSSSDMMKQRELERIFFEASARLQDLYAGCSNPNSIPPHVALQCELSVRMAENALLVFKYDRTLKFSQAQTVEILGHIADKEDMKKHLDKACDDVRIWSDRAVITERELDKSKVSFFEVREQLRERIDEVKALQDKVRELEFKMSTLEFAVRNEKSRFERLNAQHFRDRLYQRRGGKMTPLARGPVFPMRRDYQQHLTTHAAVKQEDGAETTSVAVAAKQGGYCPAAAAWEKK